MTINNVVPMVSFSTKDIPNCPICGAKPFISRDVFDGLYAGWSVGCSRYYMKDKAHGHDENTPKEERVSKHGLDSYDECLKWWNNRCNLRWKNDSYRN